MFPRKFTRLAEDVAAAAVLVCFSQAQLALFQQRAGIGAGFAKDFVESGAKVVLADANLANANKIADELNQGRGEKVALPIHCDVTSYGATLKAFQAAREKSFNPSQRIDYGKYQDCPKDRASEASLSVRECGNYGPQGLRRLQRRSGQPRAS
jgi:hypothetical protein